MGLRMSPDFDQIVQEVVDEAGVNREELLEKIKEKQEELGGFITPEGAATIVARSYGVIPEREEPEVRKLRIGDLSTGMSNIDIIGRVARIYEVREFERRDGSKGQVSNLVIQDDTGRIRVALWGKQTSLVTREELEKGAAIRLRGAYVKKGFSGNPEVNIGQRGKITIDPEDERVEDLPSLPETRVKISELSPDLQDVDLVGRVIAITEPRTFERSDESTGKVASLMIIDETGQTRVSLWDKKTDLVKKISQGDAIKIENAYVRTGLRDKPEIHVGWRGRIMLSPPSSEVSELPEFEAKLLKVGEVEPNMPILDIAARVRRIFEPKEFERDDGSKGKVMNLILADESGTIRVSFWGDMVEKGRKLSPGDVIVIRSARSKMGWRNRPEIQVGGRAKIEVNPEDIEVEELESARVNLGELEPGLDTLEAVGRVVGASEPREFTRQDGSKGKVASLTIGDQSGISKVTLWGEKTSFLSDLSIGDVIRLEDCYSTVGIQGQPEIHVGSQGNLEIDPSADKELPPLEELKEELGAVERVEISELTEEGRQVQVQGTVVHVFHRRPIFDICPECGRSLGSVDSSLMCEECGKVVTPEHRVVVSMVVDDGTGNLRAVAFGKVGERLLGKTADEIFQAFQESSDISEVYEEFDLAGRELMITGTTRRDKYFDQMEIRINDTESPHPEREVKRLLEKIRT
ncbi:hypothetical protein AKJ35_00045 [candidate division MSBL1 archaeon SCGC-AAA833F18]|uniref:Replication factor A n=2 Tax=candidate division MSBL1 TaxID=215777 RepID=A0A133VT93_9EURY|nr:hypothetical protein AKJ35_00045 [candidate division MSBL1 archaeon SCGC-AAA833F18]